MAEPLALDQFVYVDTAFGGVNRRNHVQRIAEVHFDDQSPERYISHRRATEELLVWTRTHTNAAGNPTVEGFDGAVWDPSLPFDFDDKRDPAHALGWLRESLERWARHEVPLDALRIYFSGAKGFHLEMPHTLFGGFFPHTDLHVWEKATALELMAGIPFDTAVYDKLRLWRLTNTLNAKGQRYKVRLTLEEARSLSMHDIDVLAQHPRARMATAPDDEWLPNDYLAEVWQRARVPVVVALNGTSPRSWSEERHDAVFLSALSAAIAAVWPVEDVGVSRHSDYLLPLAGFLARHLDVERATLLLKDVARRSGDHNFLDDRQRHWEEEIERLVAGSATKIATGQPVEGLPTLARRWPELAEYLSSTFVETLRGSVGAPPQSSLPRYGSLSRKGSFWEKPAVFPSGIDAVDLREQDLGGEDLPSLSLLGREGYILLGWSNLLSAYPRTGKSELLCACIPDWLAAGHTVLYLTEEPERLWNTRLRRRAEWPRGCRLVPALGVEPDVLLAGALTADEDIIIVDAIRNLLAFVDENDNSEVARKINPWVIGCRDNSKTLELVHHQRKGSGDHGEGIAGGHALLGAVDIALELLRDRTAPNRRRVRAWARVVQPGELLYEQDLMDKLTLRALGDPEQLEQHALEQRLIEELDDEWLTTRGVHAQLGEPKPSQEAVRRTLLSLAQRLLIARDPDISVDARRRRHLWAALGTPPGSRETTFPP